MKRALFCGFLLGSVFIQGVSAQDGTASPRFSDLALQGELSAPLPYEVVRAFPDQGLRDPVEFVPEPGSTRFYICQVNGRIFVVDPAHGEEAVQVGDVGAERPGLSQLYGMAFHPDYVENGLVYLCYVMQGTEPDGTRVVECRIDADTGRIDLSKERVLLTWLGGGHNGGSLQFGHEGYLYISAGDGEGPNPPDVRKGGQDCSSLLSTVMRIDVDRHDPGLAYRIPPDNPFNDTKGVRPEIWAFGFRNPWKMSFDQKTGDLWVGDVGWDRWELVYHVRRGGNYGWSVMEGRQPINVTWERGPMPISPPIVEHPHSEARSITGGYVYQGKRLPELEGAYVYGDYETGKIWALWQRQGKRTRLREIADCELRIVCFGQTHDGEIYVVDHGGGIYELQTRVEEEPDQKSEKSFPQRLSETGLFTSMPVQTPAEGLIPYEILHPMWSDGLVARRWLALTGEGNIRVDDSSANFPEGTVMVKTLSTPGDGKPVETQVMQRYRGGWRSFCYAWNEAHTDAELVPKQGAQQVVDMGDDPTRIQSWRSASRSECFVCHHGHSSGMLGFRRWQLGPAESARLAELGVIDPPRERRNGRRPNQMREEVHAARTYLDVNCASCHRMNGGGLVPMLLERHLPNDRLAALTVTPQRGQFGIQQAKVIDPGRPERSTLYYRMGMLGSGRMPHLGSQVVDAEGLALIYEWIESLDSQADRALTEGDEVSRALVSLHVEGESGVFESDNPFIPSLLRRYDVPELSRETAPISVSDPEKILALDGDAARGEKILLG
ncbi:MAG: glucose/arabinose dehydrogenase, partial [Verrucomicrobiales bacterium]